MQNTVFQIFVAIFFVCVFLPALIDGPIMADDERWNWAPTWHNKGDCGPNALYVLINIEGKKVSLQEVKQLIAFNPIKGCSLEDMLQAAKELGCPCEARFVKPSDLSKVPRPFVLHGVTSHERNLGHFVVVADFDTKKRNFALIDPVRETYGWHPESSIFLNYSGYVLVPKYPVARMWNRIAGMSLILCGLGIVGFFLYHHTDRNKNP